MSCSKVLAIFCSTLMATALGDAVLAESVGGPISNSSADVSPTALAAEKSRTRIGLALGGGGARGAAHVGVLKVFAEEGIPIDIIAGTSIGSVVGGLYAAGVSMDTLSKDFENGKLMKEFTPLPLVYRIILAPIIFIPRLFGYQPYDGLYKGVQFRTYINGLVHRSDCEIEHLPKPFAAICTNVVDGQTYRVSKGNLGKALQASTAVPGLRKPVPIDGNLYCDGGLIQNLPVPQVRDMGADFVIAVNIDERLNPVPMDSFRKVGSVSQQALRIQLADSDGQLAKQADFVIHPNTDGISLISRRARDGRKGLEAGVQAARQAMPELKRKLAAMGVQLAIEKTKQVE